VYSHASTSKVLTMSQPIGKTHWKRFAIGVVPTPIAT
jgi:hypothetical protein